MCKTYLSSSVFAITLSLLAGATWAAGEHDGAHHTANDAEVDRTISIEAGDMWFDPEALEITAGETVKFEINNTGSIEHEFVIGDKKAQEAHREMMQEMGGGHHGDGHVHHPRQGPPQPRPHPRRLPRRRRPRHLL